MSGRDEGFDFHSHPDLGVPVGLDDTDPALLRLPHPKRIAVTGVDRYFEQSIGDVWPEVARVLGDASRPRSEAVELLISDETDALVRSTPGTTNYGAIESFAIPARYRLLNGRLFHIVDALNEALKDTDLGDDVPCLFVRPPLAAAYIEFGSARRDDPRYRVSNVETGEHVLEGAYLTSVDWTPPQSTAPDSVFHRLGLAPGESVRVLEICLVGSPVGKRGILDDAMSYFNLYVRERDEDRPVAEVLNEQFKIYRETIQAVRGAHVATAAEEEELRQGITHLAKALLYLHCDACERVEEPSETGLRKRLAGLGPRKQARIARRLMHTYDRIRIQARPIARGHAAATGRTVATHLRRAHFRLARVGVGRTERKLVWIQPMLINPTGSMTPPKDYEVL